MISLVRVNKRLNSDLYYLPYKKVYFTWTTSSKEYEIFVNHSKKIEELTIDNYDLIFCLSVSLPSLKKLIINHCDLTNFFGFNNNNLLLKSSTEIILNQCWHEELKENITGEMYCNNIEVVKNKRVLIRKRKFNIS